MKVAVAQFQPKDGDKDYNLSVIAGLTRLAGSGGADIISFHEMSVTAYTFTKDLAYNELSGLAEEVPNGPSVERLIRMALDNNIAILSGLLEKEHEKIYNTYLCVTKDGVIARYRKLHPFINKHISPGEEYCIFNLKGWKCGILVCYDNNVIENVRATTLLGAELIFAPHVTGCTPSASPGSGYVDDRLWQNRKNDPDSLRREFDGPKGRGWLMKWLPARAYDNGVYYAFTNPVGYDGEQLKNGNSMIIDPYGEILTETRSFDDEITVAEITRDKLTLAGGYRYRNARRPELYRAIISQDHEPVLKPVWMQKNEKE